MLRLSADCVIKHCSAARLNEPVSASASKCSRCLIFMLTYSLKEYLSEK